jgi:hypothetical protein
MTPAEEVGKCPECGSTDKGTRYSLTPQIMDGDPLARFCRNAWHNVVPEVADETNGFTELEFQFIFGACSGLSIRDIAERYEIGEDIVQRIIYQKIFDKAGVSTRMELHQFVRDALNGELRSRRS